MTILERSVLAAGGLISTGIGIAILFAPGAFHAGYGIALGSDASLLSEIRAPGALLIALGGLMAAATVGAAPAGPALGIGATLYLAYFVGRGVSFALDGRPDDGLVAAAILELAIGGLFALALIRRRRTGRSARAAGRPA